MNSQKEFISSKEAFIVDNLERKSNGILGFMLVQSLLLADKLCDEKFTEKLKSIDGLFFYILIGHAVLLTFAIVFMLMIDNRMSLPFDKDIKKAIQPHFTLGVKVALILLFGLIPIFVLVHKMN